MGILRAFFRPGPFCVPVLLLSGATLALSQPVITGVEGGTIAQSAVAHPSVGPVEQQSITVVSAANFRAGSLAAEMIVSGFSNAPAPSLCPSRGNCPCQRCLQGAKVVVYRQRRVGARRAAVWGLQRTEFLPARSTSLFRR